MAQHPHEPLPDEAGRKRTAILFVERLCVTSWLYAWLGRRRFAQAYYVSEGWLLRRLGLSAALARAGRLTRLRFEDFPGSYYDVQREAALHANRAFHHAQGRKHPFLATLLAYKRTHLLVVALQKGLLIYYTMPRVKAWVFLAELRRRHGPIIFIPRDNLPFDRYLSTKWQSATLGCHVPFAARALNAFLEAIGRLLAPGAVFLLVGELLMRRGLRPTPRSPRRWPLAFDMYHSGIAWDRRSTDEILYNAEDFTPQRILHVVRDRLADDVTRRHFEANGCPYGEFGRVPIPIGLFLGRLLGRAIPAALRHFPRHPAGSSPAWPYLVPFLAVLRSTIAHQAFFAWSPMDVFVAGDEYRLESVVRTAVLHEYGGKTVGFSHGDDAYPADSCQYIAMDYFCYVGNFHRELLHRGNLHCGSQVVIGAGVYGLDETFRCIKQQRFPARYSHVRGTYRIIGALPTSWSRDFAITHAHLVSFYRTVLAIRDTYPDVFVIFRPKNRETGVADPAIRSLLSVPGARFAVEEDLSTYELIPMLDLMICMGCTTVGLEGLVAGKRVLYLDESGLWENPYRRYDGRLVAWTSEELLNNVKWVLDEDRYLDPSLLEQIRSHHGLRFDGGVRGRLLAVVRGALRDHRGGPATGSYALAAGQQAVAA